MRTLIIDNYDSFTFNLFHYLAEVTGSAPVVIRNDEPGWTAADLLGFDNVVISPGPGRPERAGDFGICADTIRAGTRPLLGVCLGHQGICTELGGDVTAAPEPVHGRQWPILHTQGDILDGLPSPFSAVRYHSLAVTRLPDELEAVAWTPDGVLMAVRHRHRPMWGVQFHPESICTEHGRRILRNFTELTRRWHAERGDADSVRATAVPVRAPRTPVPDHPPPEAARHQRVAYRKVELDVTAEQVFEAFYLGSQHSFWLDSSLLRDDCGRFSFMGDASGPLARVATADVWEERVTVRSRTGTRTVRGAFLEWIDADVKANRVPDLDLPFDFALGWVGYLGYELKAQCGAARAHRSPHPDAAMLFADRVIAFDHLEGAIYLLALSGSDDDPQAEEWMQGTVTRLTRIATEGTSAARVPEVPAGPVHLDLRFDIDRYLGLISACQSAIAAGETYEICLTNTASADTSLDPWDAYRLLRQRNPAPFGALLRFGSLSVLSCSPERLLRVGRDRCVESKPIKGTRPRAATPIEDEQLRCELRDSAKDRSENLMIVDLVRNDLGTCAEVGSVHVSRLFDVETYPTVHQLVSTVRARLRTDRSAVQCLRSSFPGGSMTGAPKLRTMLILDDLEDGPRGVYSGALGYFSLSGTADLSVVIRTLVVEPGRVTFGVGGAVIALSDPAEEFEETAVKATPFLDLLGAEFPDRRPHPARSAPSG